MVFLFQKEELFNCHIEVNVYADNGKLAEIRDMKVNAKPKSIATASAHYYLIQVPFFFFCIVPFLVYSRARHGISHITVIELLT